MTVEQADAAVLVLSRSDSAAPDLAEGLKDCDCRIDHVCDSGQAFARLMAQDYDVVITDIDPASEFGVDLIRSLSFLPVDNVRPEVVIWSDAACTETVTKLLAGARVAKQLRPCDGVDRLVAAVTAILDDPLQFVLSD